MADLEKTTLLRIVGRLLSHWQNSVLKWLRESTQGSAEGQFQNFGANTKKSVADFVPVKASDENREVAIASRTALRVFVAPKYRQ